MAVPGDVLWYVVPGDVLWYVVPGDVLWYFLEMYCDSFWRCIAVIP